MGDYVEKTVSAYDDTATYEESARLLVIEPEVHEFLGGLAAGSVVLDAGCAFGRDTAYMRDLGFTVRGIDLSQPLIERARQLLPDVEFSVADIRDTGFADETFGGIWCQATLLHLNDEDMHKALCEFHRILKPGGSVAISLKKGEGVKTIIDAFSSNSERFFNFKTHETFMPMLQAAGFEPTGWHYINERERFGQDQRDLDWLFTIARKID